MPRRRLPAVACAAAVALVLSACTGPAPEPSRSASAVPSAAATTVAPSTAPAPSPSASVSGSAAQQSYLGFVSQFSPSLAAVPQPTLLTLGEQVCTGFQQGRDAAEVSTALGGSTLAPDLDAADAAVIIGAAVAQLCPQYRSALDD